MTDVDEKLKELLRRISKLENHNRDNYSKIILLETEIAELREILGKLKQ